jgi:hypothetical protein
MLQRSLVRARDKAMKTLQQPCGSVTTDLCEGETVFCNAQKHVGRDVWFRVSGTRGDPSIAVDAGRPKKNGAPKDPVSCLVAACRIRAA